MVEYSLKHISGPATEPISLAEAISHLNSLTLEEMNYQEQENLESDIRAARRDAENVLGKKIGAQQWDIVLHGWPRRGFVLPLEPLISIESIVGIDRDGVEHTVDEAVYAYSPEAGLLWLRGGQSWPSIELQEFAGVRIRVNVGMQPVSDGASPPMERYPDNIRKAMLYRIGTFYGTREDVTLGTLQAGVEVPLTFRHLLSSERNIPI